jgi:uncharacterized protein
MKGIVRALVVVVVLLMCLMLTMTLMTLTLSRYFRLPEKTDGPLTSSLRLQVPPLPWWDHNNRHEGSGSGSDIGAGSNRPQQQQHIHHHYHDSHHHYPYSGNGMQTHHCFTKAQYEHDTNVDPIRQQECYLFPTISSFQTPTTNRTHRMMMQQHGDYVDTSSGDSKSLQQQQEQQDCHRQNQESNYTLGRLVDTNETTDGDGIRISQGLSATIIARSGQRVSYTSRSATKTVSALPFHKKPDGADIFSLGDDGSYVYMSNSERNVPFLGGVYGIVFDKDHQIVRYENYIRRTTRNCNGGRTPWNTWITCEEIPRIGHCWQIDPSKQRRPQKISMSGFWGGSYEAFAYDLQAGSNNNNTPSFYITEDASDGTLRRYRPPPNTAMGWDMLHQSDGIIDYLELLPGTNESSTNTFRWTSNMREGRRSAKAYYGNSEGIAINNGILAFVAKVDKLLFLLDLQKLTYTVVSTETTTLPGGGSLDAQPDHVISYYHATQSTNGNLLLLTEDGGPTPGLFAYDGTEYLSVFESLPSYHNNDEVTGIAFSPDGRYMYACLQDAGYLFQISRLDSQPFTNRRTLKWRTGLKL